VHGPSQSTRARESHHIPVKHNGTIAGNGPPTVAMHAAADIIRQSTMPLFVSMPII
jgi:hypothetical protein